MGHIQRVDRALTVAGYKLHAFVDNDHVFGVDVLAAKEDKYGVQVLAPIGHAVFAPSKRKDRPGFLFVEGRIGEDRFAAIGKTPARALWEFETHVAEKIFA